MCVAADAHSIDGAHEVRSQRHCRRLQNRYDPTTRGRKRNLLRTIISAGSCSLLELQAGIDRWESCVSRYEKKLKSKLDDEIKIAGLEAGAGGVGEAPDPQLEPPANVRGFPPGTRDVRRGEVRSENPSRQAGTGNISRTFQSHGRGCGQLASSVKGKTSTSPSGGCFTCGGAHYQRDCNAGEGKSK